MAAEHDLATFAEAKAAFGYQDDESTKVGDLITIASSRIEAYCKRKLAARDYVWILDGSGRPELLCPEYPVNSVARLTVDTGRAFSAESDVLPASYAIRADAGIIVLFQGRFSNYGVPAVIRLEANAGYDSDHAERSVLRAACLEYVDWFKTRWSSAGAVGKKGEYSADGVSVSYETEMPMHIRAMLAEFVRVE